MKRGWVLTGLAVGNEFDLLSSMVSRMKVKESRGVRLTRLWGDKG